MENSTVINWINPKTAIPKPFVCVLIILQYSDGSRDVSYGEISGGDWDARQNDFLTGDVFGSLKNENTVIAWAEYPSFENISF